MTMNQAKRHTFGALRPLVRYVDSEQAVIEVVFRVSDAGPLGPDAVELHLAVRQTRVGRETYPALVLVLLLLMLFEGYLSNRYYGPAPEPAES